MIRFIRASLRAVFFAGGSMYWIARYKVKALLVGDDFERILRIRQRWFQQLNWGLGVKCETTGELPQEPGLIVSNHRSYYDPIPILTQLVALPVGKADMKSWPIIGAGAKMSGVIFVERESVKGRATARQEIVKALQQDYFVLHYPEGTTHTNDQTIAFHPAAFKDAATLNFPVYPTVFEFQTDRDSWIGDDNFVRHFFECFGKRHTRVRISYGPKISSDNTQELMDLTKQWMDEELLKVRKNWHLNDQQK